MQQQKPHEAIRFLYALYKERSKGLREDGYTAKEAFWTDFATAAVYQWNDDADDKVMLSELMRLYLTVYCEEFCPHMAVEDEAQFLEQLRKKYYAVLVLRQD